MTKPVSENSEQNSVWIATIKRAMKEQGVTQSDLIPLLGVETRGAVGHYLSERRSLSAPQLICLIKYLNLDPIATFGFAETEPSSPSKSSQQSAKSCLALLSVFSREDMLSADEWDEIRAFAKAKVRGV